MWRAYLYPKALYTTFILSAAFNSFIFGVKFEKYSVHTVSGIIFRLSAVITAGLFLCMGWIWSRSPLPQCDLETGGATVHFERLREKPCRCGTDHPVPGLWWCPAFVKGCKVC
jgi:hypothetical protein